MHVSELLNTFLLEQFSSLIVEIMEGLGAHYKRIGINFVLYVYNTRWQSQEWYTYV